MEFELITLEKIALWGFYSNLLLYEVVFFDARVIQ